MKKVLVICMMTIILLLIGCADTTANNKQDTSKIADKSEYSIDYDNSIDFEKALNDGIDVNGKVVKFDVVEYKPDSSMGINCWSGEHLNFISSKELDVNKGDIITGLVTEKASKSLGSWKITYEVLNIEKKTSSKKDNKEDTTSGAKTETTKDKEATNNNETIKMPHSSDYYIGSEWTNDTLTEHFKELGFTTIESIACDPDDDKFQNNIFELYVCSGWLSSTNTWQEGEEFEPDTKIKIYYNEIPMLTVDNCEDLNTILTSTDISYSSFCKRYDERYVEFEAVVTEHLTYDAGTSHIIDVKGIGKKGLEIRIGDRTLENSIDESVEIGDTVLVRGKISNRWAKYYKELYVETSLLKKK